LNLREGTRRLALLLGVVGAILGGFASYVELQTTLEQSLRHNRFERLAGSDVVQIERKLLPPKGKLSQQDIADLRKIQSMLPEGDPRKARIDSLIDSASFQYVKLPDGSYGKFPADASDSEIRAAIEEKFPGAYSGLKKQEQGPWEEAAKEFQEAQSEVDKGGIKIIHWTKDYGVQSIETEDGQTLYPTPAPSAWLYLLVALFPILGFLIPWGIVRAIAWMVAGFVQPAK
jgi:hypothetical protein